MAAEGAAADGWESGGGSLSASDMSREAEDPPLPSLRTPHQPGMEGLVAEGAGGVLSLDDEDGRRRLAEFVTAASAAMEHPRYLRVLSTGEPPPGGWWVVGGGWPGGRERRAGRRGAARGCRGGWAAGRSMRVRAVLWWDSWGQQGAAEAVAGMRHAYVH